jgi:hypothetical protein
MVKGEEGFGVGSCTQSHTFDHQMTVLVDKGQTADTRLLSHDAVHQSIYKQG